MNLKTAVERYQPFDTPASRATLKKQLFMAIRINKLKNPENDRTVSIRLKPLPASPCQGRCGFGSPPDNGELEGVRILGYVLFPAHALPCGCGAYLAQGERTPTKLETTPFVLSTLRSKVYRSMSGVATSVFRMKRFGSLMGLCLIVSSFAPAPALATQEIKPFVRGSYQQIVSARQGKPFIVNLWSLTCSYCKVEMSMLKKLARKYPKLDLVLISTDTPEEEKQVAATLAKFSLSKAEAWVFADSYTERLRFEIDRQWQGELPRTLFFSAKGEVNAISGKLEQKEVEHWIKEQYSSR